MAKNRGAYRGRQKGTTKSKPTRAGQLRKQGLTIPRSGTDTAAPRPANNCSIVLPMLPSPPAMDPQEELKGGKKPSSARSGAPNPASPPPNASAAPAA